MKVNPGPWVPRVGVWQCKCGDWNNKYWHACRGRRGGVCKCGRDDEHIAKVQYSAPRIEEHPPQKANWDGDWRCVCSWWNREWNKFCGRCSENIAVGWDYTAQDGVDGVLRKHQGRNLICLRHRRSPGTMPLTMVLGDDLVGDISLSREFSEPPGLLLSLSIALLVI
jgi:hypothetical protein